MDVLFLLDVFWSLLIKHKCSHDTALWLMNLLIKGSLRSLTFSLYRLIISLFFMLALIIFDICHLHKVWRLSYLKVTESFKLKKETCEYLSLCVTRGKKIKSRLMNTLIVFDWNRFFVLLELYTVTSQRQQNALWTAHTLRCINTHGHVSSKHTQYTWFWAQPFMHFTVIFHLPGQQFLLKKEKKEKSQN